MKFSLLQHLVCPDDGQPLRLEGAVEEAGEIKSGTLVSAAGLRYPVTGFIPRFVDSDNYSDTFSKQRQGMRRHLAVYTGSTDNELSFDSRSTDEQFFQSTGFALPFRGVTLDAGCGYGRFLSVVQRNGGEVIGVDLSTDTVELAFEAVGLRSGVHIVQADLSRLPFRPHYFQRIFSIGVLHHTPDPPRFFRGLVPHLAPGGEIAVWVYSPVYKKASDRFRLITTRLPLGVVYRWCVINEILFAWARTLPVGGGRVCKVLPGGTLKTPFWMRVYEDYDNLTPRYAFTYTHKEVMEWFVQAGLADIAALPRLTAVRGWQPSGEAALASPSQSMVNNREAVAPQSSGLP